MSHPECWRRDIGVGFGGSSHPSAVAIAPARALEPQTEAAPSAVSSTRSPAAAPEQPVDSRCCALAPWRRHGVARQHGWHRGCDRSPLRASSAGHEGRCGPRGERVFRREQFGGSADARPATAQMARGDRDHRERCEHVRRGSRATPQRRTRDRRFAPCCKPATDADVRPGQHRAAATRARPGQRPSPSRCGSPSWWPGG